MHDIQLFGSLEVRTRGVRLAGRDLGGVKPRHILALLALHGAMGETELAGLLWDGKPPTGHATIVDSHVETLRRHLDPTGRDHVLTCGNGVLRLVGERVRVDVGRFSELLNAAHGRTPARALPPLIAAAHLAERPLLADVRTPWAEAARRDCRDRLGTALLDAAADALQNGSPREALTLSNRARELDPRDERGRMIGELARHRTGELLTVG